MEPGCVPAGGDASLRRRWAQVHARAPARVWHALTEPEQVSRWWAVGDIRAEVGHRFTMDMGPWGKQPCEVLAVEPERLFRFRFALNTVVTWELVPEGTGTRLKLTHEGFDLDSPMGRRAFEGMKPGWPGVLARVETVLD
ncbi:SRPBCC domain-containing protein [Myxococcus stipitatus]|uniref:SRPBCC family protein n=1 Tax=Myxococcus stipitatus TaxID=83455 RepID=UPI0031451486